MSNRAKKKIPVTHEATPWTTQPLAGMQLPGLETPSASPEAPATEPTPQALFPSKPGDVLLRRETSGRGGKVALVLSGWSNAWSEQALAHLAREARKQCGCGGTVREREIELQGEDVAKVRRFLEAKGVRVRGPG